MVGTYPDLAAGWRCTIGSPPVAERHLVCRPGQGACYVQHITMLALWGASLLVSACCTWHQHVDAGVHSSYMSHTPYFASVLSSICPVLGSYHWMHGRKPPLNSLAACPPRLLLCALSPVSTSPLLHVVLPSGKQPQPAKPAVNENGRHWSLGSMSSLCPCWPCFPPVLALLPAPVHGYVCSLLTL